MSANNSETVVDRKKGSQAEVTDDSCTVKFIEIVPLDRPSDDYHTSEFIDPVVEVKPEDLQQMKQEPSDESDNVDSHCNVKQEPDDIGYCIVGSCFTTEVSSIMSEVSNSWTSKVLFVARNTLSENLTRNTLDCDQSNVYSYFVFLVKKTAKNHYPKLGNFPGEGVENS